MSEIEKKGVLVTVPDTGNGIIVKFLQGHFQNQLKSYQGTGLGLFICKSIIQAHGGRIWAENNNIGGDSSTGATITFSLPAANKVDGIINNG